MIDFEKGRRVFLWVDLWEKYKLFLGIFFRFEIV